jgi:hypothetical protein
LLPFLVTFLNSTDNQFFSDIFSYERQFHKRIAAKEWTSKFFFILSFGETVFPKTLPLFFFLIPSRARIFKVLRNLGIDYKELIPVTDKPFCRTGPLAYIKLAESIPWNRFLGSLKVHKSGSGIFLFCLASFTLCLQN